MRARNSPAPRWRISTTRSPCRPPSPPRTPRSTALDRATDRCYRAAGFPSDRARVEYLFALYEKLTAPLAPTRQTRRRA